MASNFLVTMVDAVEHVRIRKRCARWSLVTFTTQMLPAPRSCRSVVRMPRSKHSRQSGTHWIPQAPSLYIFLINRIAAPNNSCLRRPFKRLSTVSLKQTKLNANPLPWASSQLAWSAAALMASRVFQPTLRLVTRLTFSLPSAEAPFSRSSRSFAA